jgi:hypothetical protein
MGFMDEDGRPFLQEERVHRAPAAVATMVWAD